MTEQQQHRESPGPLAGSPLLTEGQRRSLETVLRRVERAIWEMEDLLMREEAPDLLLTQISHLPAASQQALLLQLAYSIRQEIASLATTFGIGVQEESQVRKLHAVFTLLWVDLQQVQPARLRAYGALHPRLHERLGPGIERLADLTLALAHVVDGSQDDHTLPSLREEDSTTRISEEKEAAGERNDQSPRYHDKEGTS